MYPPPHTHKKNHHQFGYVSKMFIASVWFHFVFHSIAKFIGRKWEKKKKIIIKPLFKTDCGVFVKKKNHLFFHIHLNVIHDTAFRTKCKSKKQSFCIDNNFCVLVHLISLFIWNKHLNVWKQNKTKSKTKLRKTKWFHKMNFMIFKQHLWCCWRHYHLVNEIKNVYAFYGLYFWFAS